MIRFAMAKGKKGGGGGVVSLSGISSSHSLGQVSAVLQGWMGNVLANNSVGPAIPAGSFSFIAETQDNPTSQVPHATSVSLVT